MKGSLLVLGTHSDAGKSVVAAGLCRLLAREGVRVAPFKAQNMALNSYVAVDGKGEGAEIGRAQAAQAAAAKVEPEAAMNPVLLKATSEGRTQVVVMGKPRSDATAKSYQAMKRSLMPVVLEAFETLGRKYDVVICEGAGSPAEINLRENDLANMGLARAANVPAVLVGDIDRGGLFASIHGTMALLSEEDRSLVGGFIVNKFRGDPAILAPGLDEMSRLTGRPFFGTIPFAPGLELDGEDSLSLDKPRETKPPLGRDTVRVAVARLPRISNFTDFDPLSQEPGVEVRFVRSAADLLAADLAILPGTKATVEDLAWLRSVGMDRAISERARRNLPTLGVCGGYQMLGAGVSDGPGVESGEREVACLGLLPVETSFEEGKILARPSGTAPGFGEAPVSGYEIRHGRVRRTSGEPLFTGDGLEEGCRSGNVLGTSWHGILESDAFRRALLETVARERSLDWTPGDEPFASAREARFERLADLISDNLDRDALLRLISSRQPSAISRQPKTEGGEPSAREGKAPVAVGQKAPYERGAANGRKADG